MARVLRTFMILLRGAIILIYMVVSTFPTAMELIFLPD